MEIRSRQAETEITDQSKDPDSNSAVKVIAEPAPTERKHFQKSTVKPRKRNRVFTTAWVENPTLLAQQVEKDTPRDAAIERPIWAWRESLVYIVLPVSILAYFLFPGMGATDEQPVNQNQAEPSSVDPPFRVFFGTDEGGGIRVYSELDVRTLISSNEDLVGLTFDWINSKIYYASWNRIYSANEDGKAVQTAFESTQYGWISGLAFDWITRNLYGVSGNGYVFVCKPLPNGQISCSNLLTGQGILFALALDPNNGKMYWTRNTGEIMRAQMDGSDAVQVVAGLNFPFGIAIDYNASRMFWTESQPDQICSSNLDGRDIHTIVTLPASSVPIGIVVHNNLIYWGNYGAKSLQRSSKSGQDIETVFTGSHTITQLTTTYRNLVTNRLNQCEGQNCANICVLTTNAFRCIP